MRNEISNQDDVMDSRDVIERIEELEAEGEEGLEELAPLKKLAEQCEGVPDWKYGEALIRRSYFVEYIEDLIKDCYDMPKELQSGQWPWRHVTVDYAAAAKEAEVDYIEVDFDGVEYLIRSV